jgi:hypothetical protein
VFVAVVVVALLVLAAVLAVGLVGAVMEFVVVCSLRDGTVRIRRYVGAHWRAGVSLFGFRLGLSLLVLALVVALVFGLVGTTGVTTSLESPGAVLGAALVAVPLVLVGVATYALIDGLTTFFVVPVMLVESCGVLGAWRRFGHTLWADPTEYLAFVGLTVVLTPIAGTAVGAVVGLFAVLVFGPVFALGFVGVVTDEPVVLAVTAVLGVLAALVVASLAALVRVPVLTYLRYYALFVLGDTDSDLDAIPERRRAVRAGGPDGTDEGETGTDPG